MSERRPLPSAASSDKWFFMEVNAQLIYTYVLWENYKKAVNWADKVFELKWETGKCKQ